MVRFSACVGFPCFLYVSVSTILFALLSLVLPFVLFFVFLLRYAVVNLPSAVILSQQRTDTGDQTGGVTGEVNSPPQLALRGGLKWTRDYQRIGLCEVTLFAPAACAAWWAQVDSRLPTNWLM